MSLRSLRKERNLTLQYVADILGISAVQLSRIERNTRGLKVNYAQKLGDLYQTDWKDFYEQ